MNFLKGKTFEHIYKTIAFVLAGLVLLGLFSFFTYPRSNRDIRKYEDGGILAEPENTLDYVFVGSSSVSENFAPLEVWNEEGYAGFALGESRSTVVGDYFEIVKLLKNQSPSLIVLEGSTLLGETKNITIFNTIDSVARETLPLLRYHNNWKNLTAENLFKKMAVDFKSVNKGYKPYPQVKPVENAEIYMSKNDKADKVHFDMEFYFNKILTYCNKRNIKLVIAVSPSPACWSQKRQDIVKAFAEKYNIDFIDFNDYCDDFGIDWSTDSKDAGWHFNCVGSKKYSKYFAQWLKNNYSDILVDHRGDEKYSDWNECYKQSMQEIQDLIEKEKNK
ncbi:MAG: SGNH/GDSL hydrolase family protein [Clostridiales bacterium]|nr:SGNH/GDSL hydrolase family protein [Clostridiales bacterium]